MGIVLDQELIKCGYNHDETGRWIDTSYIAYHTKISDAKELKHLERILRDLAVCVDSKLKTESAVLETQFAALVAEYARSLQKYNELHWFKRVFASEPFAPARENCNAFRQHAKLAAAAQRLQSRLNRLQVLSPEFGVYECQTKFCRPVEYEILMTREDKLNFNELLQRL